VNGEKAPAARLVVGGASSPRVPASIRHTRRAWAVALFYWLTLAPWALAPRHSGNVWARYMTIERLVEAHTWALDQSPLLEASGSPDVVVVAGHQYADKPPVLSLIGAIVYAPIAWCGWRLSAAPVSPGAFVAANWLLVMLVVGLSTAGALAALRHMLGSLPLGVWQADLLTLAIGYGTLLFSYAVTFNNHSVAAGLIAGGFAVVHATDGRATGAVRRAAAAGLLAGLAATIDVPAGATATVALAVWLACSGAVRMSGVCLAAAAGPALLHALLQWHITGSPLPAEMMPELFAYPGSYWLTPKGEWHEPGPRWRWAIEFSFGPQGWITVTPLFVLSLWGMWSALRHGDGRLRATAAATLAVLVVLLAYYTWGVRRTDFAGQSFGTRHLVPVAPLLGYFAAVAWSRVRNAYGQLVYGALLGIGVLYAYAGMRDPWSRIERRHDATIQLLRPLTLYPYTSYAR
jgi:hypothetical protein